MTPIETKALYEHYGYAIYGRCMRILGDPHDAKDAMQEVFVKLLENEQVVRDADKIVPWLFAVATNYCFNLLRSRKKFDLGTEPDQLGSDHGKAEQLADREIIDLLVRTQNRKTREAVYYSYVEELNQTEIQRITGQSPATIRRRLAVFKEFCKKTKQRLELS
jgi:RNA polymerase sigma-70 factor, ECF subfamily